MIQVLHRAVDILEFIAKTPRKAAGLAEIADHLKLNRATCANILKTLADRNLIEQNEKKEYLFGPLLYRLTNGSFYSADLVEAARDVMEELTAHLNESTILAIIHKNKRITIHEMEGGHDLHVKNRMEKEVYETATGRLLLAFYNDKERESFIRKKGLPSEDIWPKAVNKEGLFKVLDKIKNDQLSAQTSRRHVVGFAVPVYKKEKVVASLGVFLPEARLSENRKEEIIKLLQRAGEVISRNLTEGVQEHLLEKEEKI